MSEQKKMRPCLGEGILAYDCKRQFSTYKHKRLCKPCTKVLYKRNNMHLSMNYHVVARLKEPEGPMSASATAGRVKSYKGAE